jgi:hypothetical protein
VSSSGVLISCISSPSASVEELEGWLAGAVARLGLDEAALYRVVKASPADQEPGQPQAGWARGERAWLLSISGAFTADDSSIRGLVGEMRLLGLEPTVFRAGPLPMVQTCAKAPG